MIDDVFDKHEFVIILVSVLMSTKYLKDFFASVNELVENLNCEQQEAIKSFLNSLAIEKHYAVIQKKNIISIVPIDDYKLEVQPTHLTDQFFSCVHCGHVTQFEAVHNNHMKIHYL